MKTLRGLLSAGAIVLLTACAESPMAPTMGGVAPRFAGGFTYGGGNAVAGATTTTSTTGSTVGCTDERGGFTYGGGNYSGTEPCSLQ